jgi:beta-barrel assembly-enhancing protease
VIATLAADGILLAEREGGKLLETWAYKSISLRQEELRRGPVRLTRGPFRLTVDDQVFAAALLAAAPALRRAARRKIYGAVIASAVFLALVGTCWWSKPWIVDSITQRVPLSWEEKLGAELEKRPWLGMRCAAPAGVAALETLTHRLTKRLNSPFSLTVAVRDVASVNAFALPGGHIVLLRGLIEKAESPDEVAGVLAHELTHATKRHPMRALIASSGLALLFEAFLGNGTGASLGAVLATLSYSRSMEAEADEGAVTLLQRAEIGTEGFARFFARLSDNDFPAYLRTHPPTPERLAAVRARAASGKRPALSPAEWRALKSICDLKLQ